MGVTIRNISNLKNFEYACGRRARGAGLSRLENGWTGYEQLEGSRYASTKRAEIEVLSCVRGYIIVSRSQTLPVRESLAKLWHALKSPPTRVSGTLLPWSIEGTTISHLPNNKNSSYRKHIQVTNFRITSTVREYFHDEKRVITVKHFLRYVLPSKHLGAKMWSNSLCNLSLLFLFKRMFSGCNTCTIKGETVQNDSNSCMYLA